MKHSTSRFAGTLGLGALLLVGAGLVAACGGGTSGPSAWAGTYVLDVEKTAAAGGGATLGGSGKTAGPPADVAALQALLGPDAYRLDLGADGRFVLRLGGGETPFLVEGTWRETETGPRTTTTTIGGLPAEGEVPGVQDLLEVEDGYVVLPTDEGRIYLRKL